MDQQHPDAKPSRRPLIGLLIALFLVFVVSVMIGLPRFHFGPRPWRVLATCRIVRVQHSDEATNRVDDVRLSDWSSDSGMLARITGIVNTAEYSYSETTETVNRLPALEPQAVILDIDANDQSFQMSIDSGGTVLLRGENEPKSHLFYTPRSKHIYDRIVEAIK